MFHRLRPLMAVPILASGLAVTAPAEAQWHPGYDRGGYYHGGYGYRGGYHHHGHGALLGGLAAGAVIGALGAGLLVNRAPPPPVVYAQPPVVYAAPPPVVYAPPPPQPYGY